MAPDRARCPATRLRPDRRGRLRRATESLRKRPRGGTDRRGGRAYGAVLRGGVPAARRRAAATPGQPASEDADAMTAIDLIPPTYSRGLGSPAATATRETAETVVCDACGCRLTTRESADDAGFTGARTLVPLRRPRRPRRPRLRRHLRRRCSPDRLTRRPARAASRRILATPRPLGRGVDHSLAGTAPAPGADYPPPAIPSPATPSSSAACASIEPAQRSLTGRIST